MEIVDRLRLFASAMKDAPTAIIDDNALRRADEIKQLRLANSDLQMYYDYAKTECDKLQVEVLKLREELNELLLSYEVVVDALKEKD